MELPDFRYEEVLWRNNFKNIAGMDEVGRGALAGPVVTAAVLFESNIVTKNIPVKIDDSKRLSCKERDKSSIWIIKNALGWGIGATTVTEINKKGIVRATNKAFRKALISAQNKCNQRIEYLLIDGFLVPYIRHFPRPLIKKSTVNLRGKYQKGYHRQISIIKGDQKSFSIAAASIIAKVWRDNYMTKLSNLAKYKVYKWDKNKGYGTLDHRLAINNYGITYLHRTQFVKNIVSTKQNAI